MDEVTREQLCAAAVKAAKAVDYVGAGTIEFIADTSDREGGGSGLRADRIWFMEMNTRLQVEHPVTEEITGVDLVEWQLRVASGEALPLRQDELSIDGWAMEARLYAEDPVKGFLPSTGTLDHLALPRELRVETGVQEGDEVSLFYDPMIAKLVVKARNREDAAKRLAEECREIECWPVKTNALFLARSLESQPFIDGAMTTGTIAAELDALAAPLEVDLDMVQNAGLQTLYHIAYENTQSYATAEGLRGFRLNAPRDAKVRLLVDGLPVEEAYPEDREHEVSWSCGGNFINRGAATIWFKDGSYFTSAPWRVDGAGHHGAHDGDILSPMPGRIIAVEVAAGDTVTKGQKLLTLEAMKMEHSLTAPFDGVVAELNAEVGAQVQVEALLVRIEANGE
jgi:3-methylcrotonyl-CoA carboxylase alpha subunit